MGDGITHLGVGTWMSGMYGGRKVLVEVLYMVMDRGNMRN